MKMAPLEYLYPDEMNSLPTPIAEVAMVLFKRVPLTSPLALWCGHENRALLYKNWARFVWPSVSSHQLPTTALKIL
jgi:hypothetical protein